VLIDFKEIEFQGGFDFERFVEDLLNALGWTILVRAGQGPDGGRDIIASKREEFTTGRIIERKYVVQCKHNAHSNNIVKPKDLTDFIIMPGKHSTQGWFLVTSTKVSEDAKNNIYAANDTCKGTIFDFWDARDMEKELTTVENCRDVLKRYFPVSYSKITQILIPSIAEIEELLSKWVNRYKDYSRDFFINPDHNNAIYSLIALKEMTISKLQSLLFSDDDVSNFIKIWNKKLRREGVIAEIGILLFGLMRLNELKEKGLHNDSIEQILCLEIESRATYRNMLRRHWNEFMVFKGKDYDWTLFHINYGNTYISPLSCGFILIIYCEKYGDVAKGRIRISGDDKEYNFIASYEKESVFQYLSKSILNLPIPIGYKLDEGSDPVLFISAGFAQFHGTDGKGLMSFSWNMLA
jgi:Restriction endonuclease